MFYHLLLYMSRQLQIKIQNVYMLTLSFIGLLDLHKMHFPMFPVHESDLGEACMHWEVDFLIVCVLQRINCFTCRVNLSLSNRQPLQIVYHNCLIWALLPYYPALLPYIRLNKANTGSLHLKLFTSFVKFFL